MYSENVFWSHQQKRLHTISFFEHFYFLHVIPDFGLKVEIYKPKDVNIETSHFNIIIMMHKVETQ